MEGLLGLGSFAARTIHGIYGKHLRPKPEALYIFILYFNKEGTLNDMTRKQLVYCAFQNLANTRK